MSLAMDLSEESLQIYEESWVLYNMSDFDEALEDTEYYFEDEEDGDDLFIIETDQDTQLKVGLEEMRTLIETKEIYPVLSASAKGLETKKYYDYINGMSIETMKWWYAYKNGDDSPFLNMDSVSYVIAKNEDVLRQYAAQEDMFYLLALRYPQSVYNNSRRKKIDMRRYADDNAVVTSTMPQAEFQQKLREDRRFIPVVRYAESKYGSYYQDTQADKQYCGTFYYVEPESNALLFCPGERTFQARNKTEAIYALYAELKQPENVKAYIEFARRKTETRNFQMYEDYYGDNNPGEKLMYMHNQLDPMNWMLTPSEFKAFLQAFYTEFDRYPAGVDGAHYLSTKVVSDKKFYVGYVLNLYAEEDDKDQIMCEIAKLLGYDCVSLTNMIGMFGIVHEILDTRDRRESFANLRFSPVCENCASSIVDYRCLQCSSLICAPCEEMKLGRCVW